MFGVALIIRRGSAPKSHAQGLPRASRGSPLRPIAEASRSCTAHVSEPSVYMLTEDGGHQCPRWLDWAVLHVEPLLVGDTWLRIHRRPQATERRIQEPAATVSALGSRASRAGQATH